MKDGIRDGARRAAAVWALLLSVWAALFACAAAEEAAQEVAQEAAGEAPAVCVGDVCYSVQEVQFSLTALLDLYEAQGYALSDEEEQALVLQTLDHFVGLGVIENKLRETGEDGFTALEEQTMRTAAQTRYETTWQGLYQQLAQAGVETTEQEVTAWLEDEGYTLDAYYREEVAAARYERILARYCADVQVNQQQVVQHYMDAFVEPDQERYQHNIPLYEQEILSTGSEAFYTPEGYRYIKHILLPFPDEVTAQAEAISRRADKAEAERQKAYDALAEAAAGGLDIAPYKARYDETVAALQALAAEAEQAMDAALPLLKEKTDRIALRLEAGETFEALMSEYSADSAQQSPDEPGFLFHAQSENWAERFRMAAASLEKPGDVSQPVVTTAGVHIIRYMADVPAGIHKLNAGEQQALQASALQAARLEKLEGLMQGWKEAYAITTAPSLLTARRE